MKKIGIPMNVHSQYSVGVGYSYFDYLVTFFGKVEIIILPTVHTVRTDLDLLLLPGGPDVDCRRYGQHPTPSQGTPNVYYEYFDNMYLPEYIRNGTPIFGICRGHQSLNVIFGGALTEIGHPTNPNDSPGKSMHEIYAIQEPEQRFLTQEIGLPKEFKVNSRHHQGYGIEDMAPDFVALYVDNKSKKYSECVEAAMHRELPIISVQWHPEDRLDNFSIDAITYLLNYKEGLSNEKENNKVSSKTKVEKS